MQLLPIIRQSWDRFTIDSTVDRISKSLLSAASHSFPPIRYHMLMQNVRRPTDHIVPTVAHLTRFEYGIKRQKAKLGGHISQAQVAGV